MQETNLIEQEQSVDVLTTTTPAPAPTMTLCSYGSKLTREELARVATPVGTATHKPIPHIAVVEKLIEALSFRQIGPKWREYIPEFFEYMFLHRSNGMLMTVMKLHDALTVLLECPWPSRAGPRRKGRPPSGPKRY